MKHGGGVGSIERGLDPGGERRMAGTGERDERVKLTPSGRE
jgi:hypothetical protein